MKKITLLFAALLAMSGNAFGQVLPKALWINEVDTIAVGSFVNQFTASSTPSGRVVVPYNYILNNNVRKSGIKLYDTNGKIIWNVPDLFNSSGGGFTGFSSYSPNKENNIVSSFGYGRTSNTLGDTSILFDKEFNILRKFNVKSPNSNLMAVEDGVFHNNIKEKAIIKYDVKAKEEWRYETMEILTVLTKKAPFLLIVENPNIASPILILDKNGKKIGQTDPHRIKYVYPSSDKGFWLVNVDFEYIKFDSTGKQTAKYSEYKGRFNYINDTEPVLADNSLLINFRRDNGIFLIRMSSTGDVKNYLIPSQIKYNDFYTNFTYKVIEINKLLIYTLRYQASDNQEIDLVRKIGGINLESPNGWWQKTLPAEKTNSVYGNSISIEENYTFFHIYTPVDKPSIKKFAVYAGDGILNWESSFSTASPINSTDYYQNWKKVGTFLYANDIENEKGLIKVNYYDGKIVWRRKDIIANNFFKQFKVDESGRESVLYPSFDINIGKDNYEIAILNGDGTSSSRFALPASATFNGSVQSIDFHFARDGKLILYTQENNRSNSKYVLRKMVSCNYNFDYTYSTDPIVKTTQIVTNTNNTEVCPGGTVRIDAPPFENVVFEWTRDGKIASELNKATHFIDVSGIYRVTIKDTVCSYWGVSNEIKVTVRPLANAEITSPKSIFCEGEKTVMTAKTNGTFFQWQKDQKDIPNATSGIFEVSEAGNYRVGVRDDKCPQVGYSNVYTIITKLLPDANISTDIKGVVYEPFSVKMTANSGTGLAYQWLKDDVIIPNETMLTYEAKKSGKYKVSVTYDGCTKLSDALTISILIPLANQEEIGEEQVQVYPNPSKGEFKIILPKSLKNADIQVFDSFGRERSLTYIGEQAQTEGLTQGVYFLRVQKGDRSITNKIIIE